MIYLVIIFGALATVVMVLASYWSFVLHDYLIGVFTAVIGIAAGRITTKAVKKLRSLHPSQSVPPNASNARPDASKE